MQDVRSHIEKVRYDASQQYSNFAGKKNFANQSQGLIRSLNANDLKSGFISDDFVKNNNFVTNNYKNSIGSDVGDWIKFGTKTASEELQRELEAKKADAAIAISQNELEKLRLEIDKLETATDKSKSGSSSTIKIIAVAGAFIIVGIATFFIFKKKKIN